MRKIILSALAALTLAAPLATAVEASAQTRQELRQERREISEDRRELRRDRRELREDRREVRRDAREARRPAWLKRGGHYRAGGVVVGDYRRHGLHAPGRGQRWVRYGNEYLLVGIASGIIAGIIASR